LTAPVRLAGVAGDGSYFGQERGIWAAVSDFPAIPARVSVIVERSNSFAGLYENCIHLSFVFLQSFFAGRAILTGIF
jgi:hypothetical protein